MMFKVNDIVAVSSNGCLGAAGMVVGVSVIEDEDEDEDEDVDRRRWTRWHVMFPDGQVLSYREDNLELVSSAV